MGIKSIIAIKLIIHFPVNKKLFILIFSHRISKKMVESTLPDKIAQLREELQQRANSVDDTPVRFLTTAQEREKLKRELLGEHYQAPVAAYN